MSGCKCFISDGFLILPFTELTSHRRPSPNRQPSLNLDLLLDFFLLLNNSARGGLFGAGGRFKGGTDPIMEKFNESISFDKR